MGRAGLVQTQLYTDNDHSDSDRSGGIVAALGSCSGQVCVKSYCVRRRLDVHGPLQCVSGGEHTGRHEL